MTPRAWQRYAIRTCGIVIMAAVFFSPWPGAKAYTLKTIYSFCAQTNCADGQSPWGDLKMDASHNIFGTAAGGGDNQQGVAFELAYNAGTKSWSYNRLYSFCAQSQCADGAFPQGHLVVDTEGNLYGTTRDGGSAGHGVAFELMPDGQKWKYKILYKFCSQANCSDGDYIVSGLAYRGATTGAPYDGASPLYGTTELGGTNNDGVVFELEPRHKHWSENVIYNFCSAAQCADGSLAGPAPVVDSTGNLYGVTDFGGTKGEGVIFELRPRGKHAWTQEVLHNFCSLDGCADGSLANELMMDANGILFGTTGSQGANGNGGVVFKLVPHGTRSKYTVLYSFCAQNDCDDGQTPREGVALDDAGNIFGTTINGGGNIVQGFGDSAGVAFELQGRDLHVLHAFCSDTDCADGAFPYTNLIRDASGNLFGTAQIGGTFYGGSLYMFSP